MKNTRGAKALYPKHTQKKVLTHLSESYSINYIIINTNLFKIWKNPDDAHTYVYVHYTHMKRAHDYVIDPNITCNSHQKSIVPSLTQNMGQHLESHNPSLM